MGNKSRAVPAAQSRGMETSEMKRSRPPRPRVKLNRNAVWELLDRLGMFQNELARQCGLSSGYLSQLMNGRRSPSPYARRRLRPAVHHRNRRTLWNLYMKDCTDRTITAFGLRGIGRGWSNAGQPEARIYGRQEKGAITGCGSLPCC